MTAINPPLSPNAQPIIRAGKETLIIPNDGLESVLAFLSMFGSPRLSYSDTFKGWHCWAELDIRTQGARVEVKSDGFHATPLEAVRSCAEKAVQVIKEFTK